VIDYWSSFPGRPKAGVFFRSLCQRASVAVLWNCVCHRVCQRCCKPWADVPAIGDVGQTRLYYCSGPAMNRSLLSSRAMVSGLGSSRARICLTTRSRRGSPRYRKPRGRRASCSTVSTWPLRDPPSGGLDALPLGRLDQRGQPRHFKEARRRRYHVIWTRFARR
jgi:hypothetical protein